MAKNKKPSLDGEFKHNTSNRPEGEILYDCPIEIKDKSDLNNYGITWSDCRTIRFSGSEKATIYFYRTADRAFAEFMWSDLDTRHSRDYASRRCMIPGKRKAFIRCPDTVSCATCPHKDDRQPPIISWDGLIETGYEPAACASVEDPVFTKLELAEMKARMDAEDKRLYQTLTMKKLLGMSVKEIASKLDVSKPRVYQLIARAKEIAEVYINNNDKD